MSPGLSQQSRDRVGAETTRMEPHPEGTGAGRYVVAEPRSLAVAALLGKEDGARVKRSSH